MAPDKTAGACNQCAMHDEDLARGKDGRTLNWKTFPSTKTMARIDASRLLDEAKATTRLALPLITGQLAAVGMGAVDAVLAGHFSAEVLGAVAVGVSLWSLAVVCAIGLNLALPPSVSQLVGAGRLAEVGPLFRQALGLAGSAGLLLFVLVYWVAPLLVRQLHVDPRLWPQVTAFLHAIAFGAPAIACYFTLRGVSDGLGHTRPTMYFGLLGLSLLGPLDWVLMYGKLGLPALGAQGSGMATAIILWAELAAFVLYMRRSRAYRGLHLLGRLERPDWHQLAMLLRLGLPMTFSLLMESSLFVAAALAIGRLGADVVASHQIALNVASVTFMLPLGLAMAITVRVGFARGREDARAVRYAGGIGIALTLLTQSLSTALMLGFPHLIAALYSHNGRVVALASQLLVLAGVFQFSDGIQAASAGALRGLKYTRAPMAITVFAYWLVGFPLGLYLGFNEDLGARGIWMGLIAGLSVAAALLLSRFIWLVPRGSRVG